MREEKESGQSDADSKEIQARSSIQLSVKPDQLSLQKKQIPRKYVIFVIALMIITAVVVFLLTFFITRAFLLGAVGNDAQKVQNKTDNRLKLSSDLNLYIDYLNQNATLAFGYANGSFSTSQPFYGRLGQAINSLAVAQPRCRPLLASCANYLTSAISILNLNTNSCQGCSSTLGICNKCTDKLNSSYYGLNCMRCTIIGSYGSCSTCQTCSPISLVATCENRSPITLTTINIAGNSCTGCSGSTCTTCQDKLGNGNIGSTCSQCLIQNYNSGFCRKCSYCTSKTVQANCGNSATSFAYLKLLYTGCTGCNGTFCLNCTDLSNNTHVGYNCSQCTLTTLNTGYCRLCYFCTPVRSKTTCKNRNNQYLYLNKSSCQGCSIIGSTVSCQICYDQKISYFNGSLCSSCILTDSINRIGYCTQCQICHHIKIRSTCLNQPQGFIYLLSNSCSECVTIGSTTTCNICQDRYRDSYYGNLCQNCKITSNGKGYCSQCRTCSNTNIQTQCENSQYFLSSMLYLSSNKPCTGCKIIGDRTSCSICYDKTLNGNIGYSCTNCILINNLTTGICSSCALCTPVRINADCQSSSIPLKLHQKSCQQCYIYGSQTTCRICRDSLNNTNVGTQCTLCTIVTQNKGYCRVCSVCTLDVPIKAYCANSGASYTYLSLNYTSCTNCSGTTCGVCIDRTGNGNKGYNCNNCNRNAINGSIGYCTGSCSVCLPVKTYTNCVNSGVSFHRLVLNQTSCSGCYGSNCQVCQDASGNGNKGLRCTGCVITQGTKGYCPTSYSCAVCIPIFSYTNCQNERSTVNQIIMLNQTSCSGCSSNTANCEKCQDSTTGFITAKGCRSCIITTGDKGYCSFSSSCNICTPVSTYTNCYNHQYSVFTLNLNSTSCSNCYGSTCGKCTDQNNGYVGYNCQGCVVTDSINGLGYCSDNNYCSVCTPVLRIAFCNNYLNSYHYLRLGESSCTGCLGSTCSTCFDISLNGNKGMSCTQCQVVNGSYGYCGYCSTCS